MPRFPSFWHNWLLSVFCCYLCCKKCNYNLHEQQLQNCEFILMVVVVQVQVTFSSRSSAQSVISWLEPFIVTGLLEVSDFFNQKLCLPRTSRLSNFVKNCMMSGSYFVCSVFAAEQCVFQFQVKCPQTEQTEHWAQLGGCSHQYAAGCWAGLGSHHVLTCRHQYWIINTLHS